MIPQTLLDLAEKLGCPIVERNSALSYLWDGKSIATHTDPRELFLVPDPDDHRSDFPASQLLHEVCHFLTADPEQYSLPEWGMRMGVVDTMAVGPKGGPFRKLHGDLRPDIQDSALGGCLTEAEQLEQEVACWFIEFDIARFLGFAKNRDWYRMNGVDYEEGLRINLDKVPDLIKTEALNMKTVKERALYATRKLLTLQVDVLWTWESRFDQYKEEV